MQSKVLDFQRALPSPPFFHEQEVLFGGEFGDNLAAIRFADFQQGRWEVRFVRRIREMVRFEGERAAEMVQRVPFAKVTRHLAFQEVSGIKLHPWLR